MMVLSRCQEEGMAMIEAYVLIQTRVGIASEVARALGGIRGIRESEVVTGPYDVIARAEADSMDELAQLIVSKVQAVEGVTRTLTCPVVRL
jgi:DNA-binding Lrp family transcriptional regulator